MLDRTLLTLAEVSFEFGLIGIDEYIERREVALWLADDSGGVSDPRAPSQAEDFSEGEEHLAPSNVDQTGQDQKNDSNDRDWLEFLFQKWVFTKSDPDPYPSTPHGHLRSPNQHWPKLNPYTGRAFEKRHQEDISERLKKQHMINLWSNEKFRDFCRSHILWYMEQFPHHKFPVRRPLRFPRW